MTNGPAKRMSRGRFGFPRNYRLDRLDKHLSRHVIRSFFYMAMHVIGTSDAGRESTPHPPVAMAFDLRVFDDASQSALQGTRSRGSSLQ